MEYRILGPLEVYDGDRPLALGGTKQRALLAMLLLHANAVVASDRLIEEIWGEEGLGDASKALQVAISRLRRTLEPALRSAKIDDVLVTRPPGYELRVEAGQLDLQRFGEHLAGGRQALEDELPSQAAARLDEALALWRGPPLADLAYESFVQAEAGGLDELRLTALTLRLDARLALGRHAEAVGELEQLVAEHPLREHLRVQLMLALYRAGRQAEALEVYREARLALVEELGIEPGEELQGLEGAILRHDPSLAFTEPASSPRTSDESADIEEGNAGVSRPPPAIELMSGGREWRVSLDAKRVTIGKSAENDVSLSEDPTASRLHAVLEQFPAGWCVADLGSSNGTWLNGVRVWSAQRVRHGDEIRVGHARLVFRDLQDAGGPQTEGEDAPPGLTARERDVLVALCRPLLARDMFTEPASTREVADELVITEAAVKQHLTNLYDKFGVSAGESRRRVRLANDALARGAVAIGDLREGDAP